MCGAPRRHPTGLQWDFGEADAQEFIDDLHRAGFVIVPKEPTNEMLAAGCAAENIGPSGERGL